MSAPRHVPTCTRRRPGRPGRAAGAVLAAGASLALLAGCASAADGAGTAGAGNAAPAAVTSAASPSVAGLAARVVTAVTAATSVHVTSDLSGVPGLPLPVGTVEGDISLAAGTPTAAAVTAGTSALRYVDGSAWVTLPGAAAATPWTLVSPDSSNPIVAMAATRLGDVKSTLAGLDPTALLAAASDLRDEGADAVDGTAATRYSFTVDPAVVAKALGVGSSRAAAAGPLPVQVWLDASDRPVKLTATPTVDGTATPVTVTLSAWDAPVNITAPDPSQVTG